MALNQEYFDSIFIELVKKKYYNANKVEAVLEDIQRQAEAMALEMEALQARLEREQEHSHALAVENTALKQQLAEYQSSRDEMTDAVCSAQSVYRVILEKANERADAILTNAEERARNFEDTDRRMRDYAVQLVDACLSRVRKQQQAALDEVDASWQAFLCGLYADEEQKKPEPEEPAKEEIPEDLDSRIKAIARELFSIEEV